MKNNYIIGNGISDKSYLKVYEKAEETLDRAGIAPADFRDIELANRIDVKFMVDRRRENASMLRSAFPDWLVIPEISQLVAPLFVPVLVPNGKRNELRSYLSEHDIYCPIHWPLSKFHRLDYRSSLIYENELSLVCDQRYSEDDMNRIIESIHFFMEA
jgi:dTDP-4-amino-4,6-dideoxygalactose transaminase